MTASLQDVFADTSFWIALVIKQDQYHQRARDCSQRISGQIVTTGPVLLETANTLSRASWRSHGVALIDRLQSRDDVEIVELSPSLWQRGWDLFRSRTDKQWSLTDCTSFVVMRDKGLTHALTADDHFRQAGFQALLLEQ